MTDDKESFAGGWVPKFESFEWDEAKRLSNIERHGIDFRDLLGFFDGPALTERSDRKGEIR